MEPEEVLPSFVGINLHGVQVYDDDDNEDPTSAVHDDNDDEDPTSAESEHNQDSTAVLAHSGHDGQVNYLQDIQQTEDPSTPV
jgi:hypothetical protein